MRDKYLDWLLDSNFDKFYAALQNALNPAFHSLEFFFRNQHLTKQNLCEIIEFQRHQLQNATKNMPASSDGKPKQSIHAVATILISQRNVLPKPEKRLLIQSLICFLVECLLVAFWLLIHKTDAVWFYVLENWFWIFYNGFKPLLYLIANRFVANRHIL